MLDLCPEERNLQDAGCKEACLLWDEVAKLRHACVVLGDVAKPLAAAAAQLQVSGHVLRCFKSLERQLKRELIACCEALLPPLTRLAPRNCTDVLERPSSFKAAAKAPWAT